MIILEMIQAQDLQRSPAHHHGHQAYLGTAPVFLVLFIPMHLHPWEARNFPALHLPFLEICTQQLHTIIVLWVFKARGRAIQMERTRSLN